MIVETNLVDLSKVKANDPTTWNNRVKFEIPRQWGVKNIRKRKRESKTEDERKQAIKRYRNARKN